MKILSPAFENGATLPAKYTCDGEGTNPPLKISEVPENTKSLALIADDPDAPSRTWIHWVLFNLDPSTTEIPENFNPTNNQEGLNSSASVGYYPACPPSGIHRYFFRIYALDCILTFNAEPNSSELEQAMQGHILAQAQHMGTYSRETK